MKKYAVADLIQKIKALSYAQYRDLNGELKQFDKKKEVANLIENNTTTNCGHCGSIHYTKHGIRNDLQRYKCKQCNKTFNQLTGTPLARLRKKGRWLNYSACMSGGMTLKATAELVGVNITTCFRWRHKFLLNANNLRPSKLNGIVEAVESYFYYSEKGSKNPSLISKEVVGKQAPKVFVLTTRDRNRNTFEQIINDFKVCNVTNEHLQSLNHDILFCSENNEFYQELSQKANMIHAKVDSKSIKKNKIIHTIYANKYKENLHEWMTRFCGVATKYLCNYLSWYRILDEYKMKIPPELILLRARSIENFPYQPLTQNIATDMEGANQTTPFQIFINKKLSHLT
jgi:transposase-like protein